MPRRPHRSSQVCFHRKAWIPILETIGLKNVCPSHLEVAEQEAGTFLVSINNYIITKRGLDMGAFTKKAIIRALFQQHKLILVHWKSEDPAYHKGMVKTHW